MAELLQVGRSGSLPGLVPAAQRARLERRARLLAWGGIGWHVVEFGIALGAGIAAGSIALIGFGADSLIEASPASSWSGCSPGRGSDRTERRGRRSK